MAFKRVGRPRIGKRVLSAAERSARLAAAQRAEGRKRLSIWISESALADLRQIARMKNLNLGDVIEALIDKEKIR